MDAIEGAVLEQPAEVIEQPTEAVEQPTEGTPGEELETTEQPEQERTDGRTLPKEVQAALKKFKEAHPEDAKAIEELRKSFFSSRQHGEFFKTPAEARQAKATLELIGGAEGISNLQSQVAAIEMVDASFEKGDPQVLDDIASDYPEGFKKLIGPAIDKLQKMDGAAYAAAMQPHTFAAMEAAGLGPVLGAIAEAIGANDLAKAKDLIGKSLQWYKGQQEQAGTRQKVDDPERQKFETERRTFEQQKEQTFRQDIGRATVGHQQEMVNKTLAPYLKSKPLGAEAKADLADGVDREIQRLLKADTVYQQQIKAMLAAKTRDPEKIKQYVNATVDEATPKAVKAVWTRRYGATPAARPAIPQNGQRPAVANHANSGPLKIAAKPNREDVDWGKTKDILYITNKAFMAKGPYKGRLVTWQ